MDVTAPEAVALHLLSDFRSEREGTRLACALPDLIARQEITLVLEAAARSVVERTAHRIEGYAGDDPELRAIARSLREQVAEFAEPMLGSALKARHFGSYTVRASRSLSGKAEKH